MATTGQPTTPSTTDFIAPSPASERGRSPRREGVWPQPLRADERSDLELLIAYTHGETDAVGELARRHFRYLARVAYSYIEHWHDAEEAAADTIYRVMTHAHAFDIDGAGSVRGWMATIAKHYAIGARRSAAWRYSWACEPCVLGEVITEGGYRLPGWATPAEELTEREREQRDRDVSMFAGQIEDELSHLTGRQREVITMHYLDGLSLREIAAELGVDLSAVKGAQNRAKANLRQDLAWLSAHRPSV